MTSAKDPEHRQRMQEGHRRWWDELKQDPARLERWRAQQRTGARNRSRPSAYQQRPWWMSLSPDQRVEWFRHVREEMERSRGQRDG